MIRKHKGRKPDEENYISSRMDLIQMKITKFITRSKIMRIIRRSNQKEGLIKGRKVTVIIRNEK